MNFCWVTLPVKNLEVSLAFYNGLLGLPINSRYTGNGVDMAMLGEEGQPKIELIFMPDNTNKTLQSDISVGIEVESLESAIELLKAQRVPVSRGPFSPNPHIRFLFILDPDGYEVQLVDIKRPE